MTTVAVLGICSRQYQEWLPAWVESVEALSTQPDEVVLVGPAAKVPSWVRVVKPPSRSLIEGYSWWRHGFGAVECDLVAWLGVDDTYRPCALDGLRESTADVVAFGMSIVKNGIHVGTWTPSLSGLAGDNGIPCGSPVRRDAFARAPLNDGLYPFGDWGLWAGLSALGCTFASTGRIDFDYRWHADTPQPSAEQRAAVRAWHEQLAT